MRICEIFDSSASILPTENARPERVPPPLSVIRCTLSPDAAGNDETCIFMSVFCAESR